MKDCRELGDVIASSKALGLGSRREVADCDALPQHKDTIQYQGAGKLICNSLQGAIVTGSLVLTDRENKRRGDGDGEERERLREGVERMRWRGRRY